MLKRLFNSKGHLVIIAVLGLMVLSVLIWAIYSIATAGADDRAAEREWGRICEKIADNQVSSAKAFIDMRDWVDIAVENCLVKEDFVELMPEERGPPTPEYGIIKIEFSDGSTTEFHNWGEMTFSGLYKKKYYLFNSEELFARLRVLHGE